MTEHVEDLDFEAENRRRRRAGLEQAKPPKWPTPRFDALEHEVARLTLENRDIVPAFYVIEVAKIWVTEPSTPGAQARAEEAGEALLRDLRVYIANKRGTRTPGEDG